MLKKVIVAAAVCGLVTGVALPLQAATGPLTCKEAAKLRYPGDAKARHAYKHGCRMAWKAAHKKAA
jgi:hypothetical protein